MGILSYKGITPKIKKTHYIAPGAKIIGNVKMGEWVNIWFNAVVRGDVNEITIGANTNIQDLSMLHVTSSHPLEVGENVTIGHSCILHGCKVGNNSLIGMGAKLLDGAMIGEKCLVGAGSIVTPGKKFPDKVMIIGAPAKVVRELTTDEIKMISEHYRTYLETAQQYMHSS